MGAGEIENRKTAESSNKTEGLALRAIIYTPLARLAGERRRYKLTRVREKKTVIRMDAAYANKWRVL